jgi:hypothetical protein
MLLPTDVPSSARIPNNFLKLTFVQTGSKEARGLTHSD